MAENPDAAMLRIARQILDSAKRVVVISGAGMSADSGIATFRGAGSSGGWDEAALVLATPEGFRADPQRVWSRYLMRRREALRAQPHNGYLALAAWEQRASVTVVTQNVDGLHTRAGSSHVVELHGSLFRFFCADNQHVVTSVDEEEQVPRRPLCNSYVRPAVVWFGEWLPEEARRASEQAVLDAHAILLVGTSLEVSSPKALLTATARWRTPIIEVNLEPALPRAGERPGSAGVRGLPNAAATLVGSAATVLPQLFSHV